MPIGNYLRVTIGDDYIEVNDIKSLPISIDYSLEDPENFQSKKSSESFDIEIPATLANDKVSNTFRNPDIEDLTNGELFRGSRNAVIESNGFELLVGKAFLKSAKHSNIPISYIYNLLGDNADWLVEMKDKTLYDFVKDIQFTFTKELMVDSWQFDGTDPDLPYVFAPVRYRKPFGDYIKDETTGVLKMVAQDQDVLVDYLRPSLSKYFIIYNAFKLLGYRIQSEFMDTEYFRRQVMPWTWGDFLDSDGSRLDAHKFLAKTIQKDPPNDDKQLYVFLTADISGSAGTGEQYLDMRVENDSTHGAFDNNDDYSYDSLNYEMIWEYKSNQSFGILDAHLSVVFDYDCEASRNSSIRVYLRWFKNNSSGTPLQEDVVVDCNAGYIEGSVYKAGLDEIFFNTNVVPGDKIIVKVYTRQYVSKGGVSGGHGRISAFQLNYFRIPIGGNVTFEDYKSFQNYKFIDFFAGIIDEFDLSVNTDPINKVVYIEPTHEYKLPDGTTHQGYFKNDFKDWNGKEDFSKDWVLENYSDNERELNIQYKDDSNDGILKLIQDRHTTKMTSSKYVFPDRFKTGIKNRDNRFFSRTMHYNVDQWKELGTGINSNISPQIICIVPENVSQTSERESANTFMPKSCYYKGLITGVGAWKYDGEVLQEYPFMFSVNYMDGGENDPVLSYSDELTDSGIIARGLLKTFFWQRFAIMRNGQRYIECYFKLNNSDVANEIHREFISWRQQKWELIQIKEYKPLIEDSTKCVLYKWFPISISENNNTYPSENSITTGVLSGSLDLKYSRLKCLISDIPT